ncbi:hypothetical protein ACH5RR_015175 [Cinchona calisaya]|uniref:Uncharacterized protein n=1 Tax=Cinchona calisaya TaxID=153742 RepID=A0ABD2ZU55_9GENT
MEGLKQIDGDNPQANKKLHVLSSSFPVAGFLSTTTAKAGLQSAFTLGRLIMDNVHVAPERPFQLCCMRQVDVELEKGYELEMGSHHLSFVVANDMLLFGNALMEEACTIRGILDIYKVASSPAKSYVNKLGVKFWKF